MESDSAFTAPHVLQVLLDALDEGVLIFDAQLQCSHLGQRAAVLFGISTTDLQGQPRANVIDKLAACSDNPNAFVAAVASANDSPQLVELARPERRFVVWSTMAVAPSSTQVALLDIVREVTRERAAERHAEELTRALAEVTTIDPVTGLINRRRFTQDLDREHRRAQRAWEPYAIARIGIRNADPAGPDDTLLRILGEDLRAARREYDLVARWDATEFIVCLPGVDATSAKVVLERALLSMRQRAQQTDPSTTLHAGVALWIPPSGDGPEDMTRRAGSALELAVAKAPSSIMIDAGAGRWKDEMNEGG